MADKTQVKCYKCDGTGQINAFGHVANGVCFACKGAGTLMVDLENTKGTLGADFVTKCEFILNANHETFEGLSYARLFKAREFAHTYVMAKGARDAYGDTVYSAWFEFGEPHFQRAQEEKLAKFYAE